MIHHNPNARRCWSVFRGATWLGDVFHWTGPEHGPDGMWTWEGAPPTELLAEVMTGPDGLADHI